MTKIRECFRLIKIIYKIWLFPKIKFPEVESLSQRVYTFLRGLNILHNYFNGMMMTFENNDLGSNPRYYLSFIREIT